MARGQGAIAPWSITCLLSTRSMDMSQKLLKQTCKAAIKIGVLANGMPIVRKYANFDIY